VKAVQSVGRGLRWEGFVLKVGLEYSEGRGNGSSSASASGSMCLLCCDAVDRVSGSAFDPQESYSSCRRSFPWKMQKSLNSPKLTLMALVSISTAWLSPCNAYFLSL